MGWGGGHSRAAKTGAKIGGFGRQNALFPKLFLFLQIRFFGGKRGFTESGQGFFWGGQGRFWPCILYPRWAVAFEKVCLNSKHED
jgi:hypothetical protein